MKLVKKAVQGLFNSLGYTIMKNSKQERKWIDVHDAIGHNSIHKINEFYNDENLLKDYINEDRISFYKEVALHLSKAKIHMEQKHVVDVGCGTGHLLHYVSEIFPFRKATGLEYSPEAVKIAKNLFPAFEFFEYDIYHPWQEMYDIVLCTEVLEHLLYPEAGLGNLMKMCKDNGCLFITVPNGRIDTFGGHINYWSPESWDVFIQTNCKNAEIVTGTMIDNRINYALIKKQ